MPPKDELAGIPTPAQPDISPVAKPGEQTGTQPQRNWGVADDIAIQGTDGKTYHFQKSQGWTTDKVLQHMISKGLLAQRQPATAPSIQTPASAGGAPAPAQPGAAPQTPAAPTQGAPQGGAQQPSDLAKWLQLGAAAHGTGTTTGPYMPQMLLGGAKQIGRSAIGIANIGAGEFGLTPPLRVPPQLQSQNEAQRQGSQITEAAEYMIPVFDAELAGAKTLSVAQRAAFSSAGRRFLPQIASKLRLPPQAYPAIAKWFGRTIADMGSTATISTVQGKDAKETAWTSLGVGLLSAFSALSGPTVRRMMGVTPKASTAADIEAEMLRMGRTTKGGFEKIVDRGLQSVRTRIDASVQQIGTSMQSIRGYYQAIQGYLNHAGAEERKAAEVLFTDLHRAAKGQSLNLTSVQLENFRKYMSRTYMREIWGKADSLLTPEQRMIKGIYGDIEKRLGAGRQEPPGLYQEERTLDDIQSGVSKIKKGGLGVVQHIIGEDPAQTAAKAAAYVTSEHLAPKGVPKFIPGVLGAYWAPTAVSAGAHVASRVGGSQVGRGAITGLASYFLQPDEPPGLPPPPAPILDEKGRAVKLPQE